MKRIFTMFMVVMLLSCLWAGDAEPVKEASFLAQMWGGVSGWLANVVGGSKNYLLLLLFAYFVEPLISKYAGKLYKKWIAFSDTLKVKYPKVDDLLKLADKLVLAETGSLMELAKEFKEASRDGKLTDAEKQMLRDSVKNKVIMKIKNLYPELASEVIECILEFIDSSIDWKVTVHKKKLP